MNSRRRSSWLIHLCLIASLGSLGSAVLAGETRSPSDDGSSRAATAVTRDFATAKSTPTLTLPGLLRLRWTLLLEELMKATAPPPPEVNGTRGLSDDPDPVGTSDGGNDDGKNRDGSKSGWKSHNEEPTPDAFDGPSPNAKINLPLP